MSSSQPRSVEVTAKKREEAIETALKKLGVERHDALVEILDEGSKGLFGFGARDVRVRVSVDPDADLPDHVKFEPAPAVEDAPRREPRQERQPRPDRPQRQERGERGDRPDRSDRSDRPARGPRQERGDRPDRGDRPPRQERGDRPPRQERGDRGDRSDRSDRPDRGPRQERQPRPDRGPRQERGDRPDRAERPPRPERSEQEPRADRGPDPRGEEASALLRQVISNMGLEAQVRFEAPEEGGLQLIVDSPDSALLIGRKGRNLAALQYLINRMVGRIDDARDGDRILVDVEGYQDRRKAMLEEMALRMAQRAKETGRRIRVKPLNPQERRIIHVALQDDADIRTFSVGDSMMRSVVIAPKDAKDSDSEEDVSDFDSDGEIVSEGGERDRERSRERRPYRGGRRRSGRGRGQGGGADRGQRENAGVRADDTASETSES